MALINRKKKTEVAPAVETKNDSFGSEKSKTISFRSNDVIVRPLITEKSAVSQSLNKYSFIVKRDAKKVEIKRAFKEIYDIVPTGVNVINVDGKVLRRGAITGRRSDYKKAIITLPEGKSIAIHEGV